MSRDFKGESPAGGLTVGHGRTYLHLKDPQFIDRRLASIAWGLN
jgi:hypothetical protein